MDVSEPEEDRTDVTERTRPNGTRPPLLRVLAEAGVAPEEDLRLAFAEGMGSGERFGEVVLRHGWLDETGLARALADQWNLLFLDADAEVDHEAAVLIGAAASRELQACPVAASEGRFVVAVAEPSEDRFAAVCAATATEPSFAIVAPATLARLLEQAGTADSTARTAAAEAVSAKAAEDDPSEASLHWLDAELDAATTQLVSLRERAAQLVAADRRKDQELADSHAQIAALHQARTSDRARISALEAELAQKQQRLALAKAKLADASEILDE
jgi:hypothetical protein